MIKLLVKTVKEFKTEQEFKEWLHFVEFHQYIPSEIAAKLKFFENASLESTDGEFENLKTITTWEFNFAKGEK